MCYECWVQCGKPALDSDRIQTAVKQIVDVYEWSLVGGHLHIALDDWNLDDASLQVCGAAIEQNRGRFESRQIAAERTCLAGLRSLTEEERASALARYEGFVKD